MLQCLDVMLTKRRKQVTLQRAMAFVKRLCTLSMHVLPNASIGIMAASRAVFHVSTRTSRGTSPSFDLSDVFWNVWGLAAFFFSAVKHALGMIFTAVLAFFYQPLSSQTELVWE